MQTNEEVDIQKALEKYKIEYSATFVPWSQSRNKDEKQPSLNWLIRLSRKGQAIETDYMQGCGHVAGYKQLWNPTAWEKRNQKELVEKTCETGKAHKYFSSLDAVRWTTAQKLGGYWIMKLEQPQPILDEVLYSLLMDADVLNYATFEEWAGEFGYEEDSRSAEKVYQACLKIALQLKQMFTEVEIKELRELFQER